MRFRRWVDDSGFALDPSLPHEKLIERVCQIQEIFFLLGIPLNHKSNWDLSTQLEWAGIIHDTENQTMRVPLKGLLKVEKIIDYIIEKGRWTCRQITQIHGKYNWFSNAIPVLTTFSPELLEPVIDLMRDFPWWTPIVEDIPHFRVQAKAILEQQRPLTKKRSIFLTHILVELQKLVHAPLVNDIHYISVDTGKEMISAARNVSFHEEDLFFIEKLPDFMLIESSTLRELFGIGRFILFFSTFFSNSTIVVYNDNWNVVKAINRRWSKTKSIDDLTTSLLKKWELLNITVVAKWLRRNHLFIKLVDKRGRQEHTKFVLPYVFQQKFPQLELFLPTLTALLAYRGTLPKLLSTSKKLVVLPPMSSY